jgi:hypothetical protein
MIDLLIYEIYKQYKLWSSWKCQWEAVPDETFMTIIYEKERMKGISGAGCYREEYKEVV